MGVKGLWDIVAPSGIRVRPEALEGQTLAIDASIWLKQFLIGMKDKEGKVPYGVHLLGFFKRICKLLYYGIQPIVVFDGTPPDIKRRTLELRRMQREISEINMRRVANKLLLNSIRLRVAKKIKGKVSNVQKDDIEENENKVESSVKNLFSSSDESESEDEFNDDEIINGSMNFNKNSESTDSTHFFPILGFLSERRRLDEMPEIDTNLFKMPISLNSKYKSKSKKFVNIDDFNLYIKKSSDQGDERRLMDLPLDTEIDPQVFEQLNSKLQYEILIQLRDAWISALRTNAVNTKDNMNQFSNSQIECYLRYLRINQEIEKLKLRMAKECEEEKLDFDEDYNDSQTQEEIEFVEYGQVYDPDNVDHNAVNEKQTNSSISTFNNSQFDENGLTLTDKILNYSINKNDNEKNDKCASFIYTNKSDLYNNSIKFTKKERIKFLQSTNYYNSQATNSKPLNTPLMELERLLKNEQSEIKKNEDKMISRNMEDLNNKERLELLKEDIEDLFGFNNQQFPILNKNNYDLKDRQVSSNNELDKYEDEEDWKDIDWVSITDNNSFEKESKSNENNTVIRNMIFSNKFVSDIELNLNKVLEDQFEVNNTEKKFSEYIQSEEESNFLRKDVLETQNDFEVFEMAKKNIDLEIKSIVTERYDFSENISQQKEIDINEMQNFETEKDIESEKELISEIKQADSESIKSEPEYSIMEGEFKEKDIYEKPEFEKTDVIEEINIDNQENNFEHSEFEKFTNIEKNEAKDFLNLELESEKSKNDINRNIISIESETEKDLSKFLSEDITEEIKQIIEMEDNLLFNEDYFREKNIDDIMFELEKEQQELTVQFNKQDVILNSEITKEMQIQICSLLEAFGIPWIESPSEAEAQASILTKLNLCHGVLSDDSDCLIFGAKKIYRNFFSGTSIEMYDIENVKQFLGVKKQDQMYVLALLLGCDYTVGVNGIGPVNAVEILKAYPDLEDMILLKDWSMSKLEDKHSDLINDSFERIEFKKNHVNYRHSWVFPSDFPCINAINAMKNPIVNYNFCPSFGKINKSSIIDIMVNNTDLTQEKVCIIIDPIIKNQQNRSKQTKIDQFLYKSTSINKRCHESYSYSNEKEQVARIISKRMKKALIK